MRVLRQCDVLLVLGVSGRGTVFDLPGRFQCIRVDRDPSQLLLSDRAGVGLCGTVREVLQRFCSALADRRSAAGPGLWSGTREYRPWYARLPRSLRSNGVQPSVVASTIGSVLDRTGERGIVTVDVGLVTLWIYRFLTGDHEKIWTGSFATMGFALPAAIVAARRHPTRPVVAACGDGGICVTMAELATAGRLGLPLTVVVFNNGKLGAIKYEQQVMGWPEYGSHLWNCDFAAYARACSAVGLRVDSPDQLEGALTEAVAARRPYLVEVICDPDELPVPAQGPHPLQAAGVLLTFGREVRRKLLGPVVGNPRDSIANRRLRAQKDIR
jgi:thiamine pyrophosphate-dependent acetolactate synthase large subunit-like protein